MLSPKWQATLGITLLAAGSTPAQTNWTPHVREVADFVLSQQTPQGCIADAPGGLRANEDAAMARSLFAAACAWRTLTRMPYRNAWRDGIRWLAGTMERQGQWAGTWRYAYAGKPPNIPLPTSPDGASQDARGFSSAAALFAYHVALYTHLTGDETVALACRSEVQAALDFVLEKNRAPNDLFYRGWVQPTGKDGWELWRRQRATDQAEVLLGLWAGSWLLGHPRYRLAASRLEQRLTDHFFHKREQAFGTAITEAGGLLPPVDDDPESLVTQAYLAWVLGPCRETEHAMKWLEARMAPDGTFRRKKDDPAAVLPVAAFCLGASRVGSYANELRRARRWLRDFALTPKGGVRETADQWAEGQVKAVVAAERGYQRCLASTQSPPPATTSPAGSSWPGSAPPRAPSPASRPTGQGPHPSSSSEGVAVFPVWLREARDAAPRALRHGPPEREVGARSRPGGSRTPGRAGLRGPRTRPGGDRGRGAPPPRASRRRGRTAWRWSPRP